MAEKKINGRTFKVQPMLATKALVMQARIIKLIGPGVGNFKAIMGSLGSGSSEEQKGEGAALAIRAIADIFAAGDPEQMVALMKDIMHEGMILRPSGEYYHIDLDADFVGYEGDIYTVLFFILSEQFASFFTGLRGIGNLRLNLKA